MDDTALLLYIDNAFAVIKKTLYKLEPELMDNYGTIEHDKKSDKSAVTHLDKKVESELKLAIGQLGNDIGFIGEEFGMSGSDVNYWTIDPIDGTEAFIRGMPFCSNMLCLVYNNVPVASLIYNFPLRKMYTAIKGKGAFCNDMPISVSNRQIDHANIIFYVNIHSESDRQLYFKMPRYSSIRLVTAGYEFCLVASGAVEARVQWGTKINIWDYLPGVLLVQEAGGSVANIGSQSFDFRNLDFIVSNNEVHGDLQEFFKSNKK